ncbi:MAG: trigger factor [Paludisphaera borealis]|uniref:trigger factor n=1 Tax=Paludisphaera borealis TaxID=1387353 RepID=UPI00284A5705|nr:trigger factor [Paludisphaera borealis]MDR3619745.1 trigger factor [Paludisphaera borealis]
MSTGEERDQTSVSVDEPEAAVEPEKRKLEIDVQIDDAGACKKHVKITIPRAEIDRQFDESLGAFQKEAQVPGFRPGRAPKTLVVKRFRKQVSDQVKSTLLMETLEQVDRDYQLNPITQPKLDVAAISLPDEGPLSFDMEVEVRPEFAAPVFKGLKVKRPIRTVTDKDVDSQFERFLERYAQIVPKLEGAAQVGDYLTADLTFLRDDGTVLNEVKEIQFRLQPELRFQDGRIPEVGKALAGAKPGESREVDAQLGTSVADPDLRGKTVKVKVVIHDLKQVRLPEVNPEFLTSIGFDSVDELREAVRDALNRRIANQQRAAVRRQVLDKLIEANPFDLPADLVSRQEKGTISRLAMELRQEGFSPDEIRARQAEIRANAHEMTLRSLKEFFVLAKVAEAEEIKIEDEDLELEIEAMAEKSNESVRRVRARVEKEGLADALATQILERKALDRILESIEYEDVAADEPDVDVETLDEAATPEAESDETAGESSEG